MDGVAGYALAIDMTARDFQVCIPKLFVPVTIWVIQYDSF